MSAKYLDSAVPDDYAATTNGSTELRRQEVLLKTGALQSAIFNSANFSSIATDAKGVIRIFNVGAVADDFLKSFQIGVETFKGTVQLSGFVNSQKAADKAAEIVWSVKGVKSIKNDLIVK